MHEDVYLYCSTSKEVISLCRVLAFSVSYAMRNPSSRVGASQACSNGFIVHMLSFSMVICASNGASWKQGHEANERFSSKMSKATDSCRGTGTDVPKTYST